MRTGRGYLNFPELNLGLSLSEGFAELAKAKLGPAALRLGVLTGKRWGNLALMFGPFLHVVISSVPPPARAV